MTDGDEDSESEGSDTKSELKCVSEGSDKLKSGERATKDAVKEMTPNRDRWSWTGYWLPDGPDSFADKYDEDGY